MKTLKLKNDSIVQIYNLLEKIPMRGAASRGKTKLQKRLQEKESEYLSEKSEIQKEYTQLDEDGNFITLDDGVSSPLKEGLTLEDKEKFLARIDELQKDTFEISFSEYSDKFEQMFKALSVLDMELIKEAALAYDELMDAYEANEDKNEEEK